MFWLGVESWNQRTCGNIDGSSAYTLPDFLSRRNVCNVVGSLLSDLHHQMNCWHLWTLGRIVGLSWQKRCWIPFRDRSLDGRKILIKRLYQARVQLSWAFFTLSGTFWLRSIWPWVAFRASPCIFIRGHHDCTVEHLRLTLIEAQLNLNADHVAGLYQDNHGGERPCVSMSPCVGAVHLEYPIGTVLSIYTQSLLRSKRTTGLLNKICNNWINGPRKQCNRSTRLLTGRHAREKSNCNSIIPNFFTLMFYPQILC